MSKIPQQKIDDLLAQVDIVSVINAHVPLQKAGNEYKACCPFHEEKTPSFTVSPAKQFYYCFSCGVHGTALTFLMQKAGLPFHDALDQLAASAGVESPAAARTLNGSSPSYHALFEVLDKSMSLFQRRLNSNKQVQKYLQERGISRATAEKFSLGYAPNEWDAILKEIGTSPVAIEQLAESGMLSKSDKGKTYDRFRNRVMFPIEGDSGKVVAFGGRTIADAEPKYLNSPETPVFQKGSELFGLSQALPEIRATGKALVVEGYFDVLALHEHGVRNAVAALGTSVTQLQISRLFRTATEIILVMDGDDAGRRATSKAIRTALPFMEDGRKLSVHVIPGGNDPDTAIRENPDCLDNLSADAIAFDDFVFDEVINAGSSPRRTDDQARALIELCDLVAKIPGDTLRELLTVKLAHAIGLDVSFVRSQIDQTRQKDVPAMSVC